MFCSPLSATLLRVRFKAKSCLETSPELWVEASWRARPESACLACAECGEDIGGVGRTLRCLSCNQQGRSLLHYWRLDEMGATVHTTLEFPSKLCFIEVWKFKQKCAWFFECRCPHWGNWERLTNRLNPSDSIHKERKHIHTSFTCKKLVQQSLFLKEMCTLTHFCEWWRIWRYLSWNSSLQTWTI